MDWLLVTASPCISITASYGIFLVYIDQNIESNMRYHDTYYQCFYSKRNLIYFFLAFYIFCYRFLGTLLKPRNFMFSLQILCTSIQDVPGLNRQTTRACSMSEKTSFFNKVLLGKATFTEGVMSP